MQKVISKAPLRIGLAGGGTDVPAYFEKWGGSVLNITINKYAYCTIESNDGSENLLYVSIDTGFKEECGLDNKHAGKLLLHDTTIKYLFFHHKINPVPLVVTTYCEAPMGSGLGSSSAIVVSMVVAFHRFFNIIVDEYTVAELAVYIERKLCALSGGIQDQYSSVFGGVNFLDINVDGTVIVSPLNLNMRVLNELSSNLLMFFTGISRESAKIIDDQSNSFNSSVRLAAMHALKEEASMIRNALLRNNFDKFHESLNRGWESKKLTSSAISNNHINSIVEYAMSIGAQSCKVSGAGGGGFMLFMVPVMLQDRFKTNLLEKHNGYFLDTEFTFNGATAWNQ